MLENNEWLLLIDALQWPATIMTLIAAWLVGSEFRAKRRWGFGCFILSNVLWIAWGWHTAAYALIVLQFGLFAINIRGAKKTQAKV